MLQSKAYYAMFYAVQALLRAHSFEVVISR